MHLRRLNKIIFSASKLSIFRTFVEFVFLIGPLHSNRVNDEEKSIPDDPDSIQTAEQTETISNATRTMFRIHIEIDCALHLPLEPNQGTEPTVYVSFEAFAPNVNVPNSIVYTTDVIECSCSPQWNKQYEVSLPVDFLTDVRSI